VEQFNGVIELTLDVSGMTINVGHSLTLTGVAGTARLHTNPYEV